MHWYTEGINRLGEIHVKKKTIKNLILSTICNTMYDTHPNNIWDNTYKKT